MKPYIANKTPFEAAMADVKANFGLTLPTDPDAASAGKLLLTDYEVENLRKAYERTLEVGAASQKEMSQQDYELYGIAFLLYHKKRQLASTFCKLSFIFLIKSYFRFELDALMAFNSSKIGRAHV